MPDKNLEKQVRVTYLAMIKNSPGTKIFNSAFVKDKKTGQIFDVLSDGELSCAFFVSSILTLVGFLDKPHSTVKTVVEKLSQDVRWKKVDPKNVTEGDVLVWESVIFEDGTQNEHIGFYIGDGMAVSTSWKKRMVVKHSYDFEGGRKIITVFRPNTI